MATAYTDRLIIVVKPAIQSQANQIALIADPTTSPTTFRAPLRTASDTTTQTVVAYWTGWTMTADQRARLTAEFGKLPNYKLYAKGDNVTTANRNFWVFDGTEGTGWTSDEVLAALSMAPVSVPLD